MKRYALIDLKKETLDHSGALVKAFERVISRVQFFKGSDLNSFEKKFADFVGTEYAIGVSSGTAALSLSLKAIGVGQGDEVITSPFTYFATAEAIINVGAKPVFVDVNKNNLGMEIKNVEKAITSKTKAVVPIHVYGLPMYINKLVSLAKTYEIKVVEDCSHADGTKVGNKMLGSFGVAGCFSLYPSKILGAFGDAGVVVTDSKQIQKKIVMLRDHGRKEGNKDLHHLVGGTMCMDNLQAAILNYKLRYLKNKIKKRQVIANVYNGEFEGTKIKTLKIDSGVSPSWYVYTILIKRRHELMNYLSTRGIESKVYYPTPLHLQPALKYLGYKKGDFPVAEKISRSVLSLPLHQYLKKNDVQYISGQVKSFFS